MSLFGKPNVNKLKEKRDIKSLIGLLEHKDMETRGQVILALGEMQVSQAVAPIFQQMAHRELEAKAMQALTGMQPGILPFLFEKLCSRILEEREHAKKVLKSIGPSVIPGLWDTLMTGNEAARENAAGLLDEIDVSAKDDLPQAKRIAYLIAKKEFNGCIQFGQDAVGPLREFILLPDTGYYTSGAVEALAVIGGDAALEAIETALLKARVYISLDTALAISSMKAARAIEVLVEALKLWNSDSNEDRREVIAYALGETRDKRVAIPLAQALSAPYPHFGMCQKIAQALVKINDPCAVEVLASALDSESWNSKCFAEEAIKGLLDKNMGCVINGLAGKNEKVRILAAQAAVKHGAAPAIPLLEALEHAEGDLCWYISKSLVEISKAPGINSEIKERIMKHQSVIDLLHQKCAICGAEVSEATAERYGEGKDVKWFCRGNCWNVRGRVVGGLAGKGCPYYTADRMCSASRPELPCSMNRGYFATDCSVYAYKARGVLPY